MIKHWVIVLPIIALAAGCEEPPETASPQHPRRDPTARLKKEVARLEMELRQRDLRIREMAEHTGRLSASLKEAQFQNEQLRKQLTAVGDAPRERDLYKRLAAERALEVRRLWDKISQLQRELGRPPTTAPTTAPATAPATSPAE